MLPFALSLKNGHKVTYRQLFYLTLFSSCRIIIKFTMKAGDKNEGKKKEKSALVKAVSASLLGRKSDIRKPRMVHK